MTGYNYILVLRDRRLAKTHIWKANKAKDALQNARKFIRKNYADWSEEADEFLLLHYRKITARALAIPLSRLLCRTITKNSVISRWHKLQRIKPNAQSQ